MEAAGPKLPGDRVAGGRLWAVGAAVAASWGVGALVGVPVLLWRGQVLEALLGLVSTRAAYWFAAGSWLRTPWGHLEDVDPLPAPPPVDARRLNRYLLLAGFAAIALTLTLAFQALDGHWVD